MAGLKNLFIGAGLVTAAFIPGLNVTVASLMLSTGLGFVSRALEPQPIEQQRQGALTQSVSTTNHLQIVYGIARVAGSVVWHDTRDTAFRLPNDRLDIVSCLCLGNRRPQGVGTDGGEFPDIHGGAIGGFGVVYFDDIKVIDADQPSDVDFADRLGFDGFADNTARSDFFRGNPISGVQFTFVNRHFGRHDQAADTFMTAYHGSHAKWPWTADHKLGGIAYLVASIVLNDNFYPPGSPAPNITAVLKGRHVFDPRARALPPPFNSLGSWRHTDNWALCVRDYLLDEIAGCALTLPVLNEASFVREADVSDQEIILNPTTGLGRRRYTVNGVVDTSQSTLRNLQQLLFTGGGFLVWEQGEFHLRRMTEETPIHELELDETNIIGDWELTRGEPSERINVAIGNYIDPTPYTGSVAVGDTAPKDQVLQAQHPAEDAAVNEFLAEDQGFEVPKEFEFPFVTSKHQCVTRLAEEMEHARANLTATLTVKEEALQYALFDRVALSHQTFAMQKAVFWVLAMGLNFDDTVRLGLKGRVDLSVPFEEFAVPELIEVSGKPFEIIYVDSTATVWIGLINPGGDTQPYQDIYDVVTGARVRTIAKADVGVGNSNYGYGSAYHPDRDEVWVYGEVSGEPAIAVFDPKSYALKAHHVYTGYQAPGATAHAIEYSPGDGQIYAGMRKMGGSEPSGVQVTVVRIDPATGAITGETRPPVQAETADDNVAASMVTEMVWDASNSRMVAQNLRDYAYPIDPTDQVRGPLSGALGGIIDTGGTETEQAYNEFDGKIYKVHDLYGSPFRYAGMPSLNFPEVATDPAWKTWGGGQVAPKAVASAYVSSLRGVAISRGHSGILYTDPNTTGKITVYDTTWGQVIRDYVVDFHPARLTYCKKNDALAVLHFWTVNDPQYYVEFIGLGGTYLDPDSTIPEQPNDPTQPAPAPSEPDSPDGLPADAPEVTGGVFYCIDGMTETAPGSGLWTGSIKQGAEIDYIASSQTPAAPVQVGIFAKGSVPERDEPIALGVTSTVDADTVRLQAREFVVDDPVATKDKPICTTADRNEDTFVDAYVRHDLGGGSFSAWSNRVFIRLRSAQPIDTSPTRTLPDDPIWSGDPPPVWESSYTEVHCTQFEDGAGLVTRVTVDAKVTYRPSSSSAPGGPYPVQIGEFAEGADPNSATPLRTVIPGGFGRNFWNFRIWDVAGPGPLCATVEDGTSATPAAVRDYYVRYITSSQPTYGPWSARERVTIPHPGP